MNTHIENYLRFAGQRIKEVRNSKDISMRELAGKLDMSHSTIARIEQCDSIPTLKMLLRICLGLEVSLFELLGDDFKPQ